MIFTPCCPPAPRIQRLVDPLIAEYLAGLPAIMLVGPRATGKTTTAIRSGLSVLLLDRLSSAGPVNADPDAALSAYDEPVVIDEWQLVPEVLGAVNRAVDEDSRPGRFILTGSLAADLTSVGWLATGKVVRVPIWGLTQRELVGDAGIRPFIDPGLLGPLLGLDLRSVLRSADLLGRVIDSLVTAQLRAKLAVCDEAPRMFHLRESHGRHEIDLILESSDGRVVALERADRRPIRLRGRDAQRTTSLHDRRADRRASDLFHLGS